MSTKAIYKYNFVIVRIKDGYLVMNKNKPFESGHTHTGSFNSAISMVKLVKRKQIPNNKSDRFIESLCRVSEDKDYIELLQSLETYVDFEKLMSSGEIDVGKCMGR